MLLLQWDTSDMKAVFRTKQQLKNILKDGNVDERYGSSGKSGCLYLYVQIQSQTTKSKRDGYGCKQ